MMANQENSTTPPPTPFDAENVPESVEKTEDQTIRELRDVPVEAVPDAALAPEDAAVKHAETPEARETRRDAEDALNKPVEAIEDAVNAMDKEDQAMAEAVHALPHRISNETVLMGYTIPLPIYTVVYITLAIFTAVEVGISSLEHGWLTAPLLVGISAAKAVLVVLFYMHLKEDSRLFAFALILPMFIALVASIFLLTVPTHGY